MEQTKRRLIEREREGPSCQAGSQSLQLSQGMVSQAIHLRQIFFIHMRNETIWQLCPLREAGCKACSGPHGLSGLLLIPYWLPGLLSVCIVGVPAVSVLLGCGMPCALVLLHFWALIDCASSHSASVEGHVTALPGCRCTIRAL